MTMNTRDLRHRVRVEHAVLRINDKGELNENFTSSHNVWASIIPKGYDRLSHGQRSHIRHAKGQQANYTITVRYNPAFQQGTLIVGNECCYHVVTAPTHDTYKRWTFMEACVFNHREIDHA